jgi:hypothetical protein
VHWTLALLFGLCGLCAALNAVQFAMTRTVRTAGLLVCAAWAVQQGHWWATGGDSLALFLTCDALLIAWFLSRRRAFDLRERLVAAAVPLTTALAAFASINDGHTAASWWANYSLVAGQMLLGLPTPRKQPIGGAVSHGTLWRARRGGV